MRNSDDQWRVLLRIMLMLALPVAVLGISSGIVDRTVNWYHGGRVHAQASQAAPAPPAQSPPAAPQPAAPTVPVCSGPYCPTDAQRLQLENLQLKAQMAQYLYASKSQQLPEFQQFQIALTAIFAECAKVRDEHKWPATVDCDIQQQPIKFIDKKAAAAAASAPVK